ncbi:hypothetical protein BURK1_02939 [Burkholderiales bacterium]|nr:hypothetical protein BURK1_02939 [Burkholderiales bacterium]
MNLAESLRSHSFRRWYERQLVECHLWLVTGFLALIMTAIAVEMIAFRDSAAGMVAMIAIGGGGAALCLYAWLKFNRQLGLAEHVAGQATCSTCRTYGRLSFVSASHDAGAVMGWAVRVRCRSCGHEWSIA